LEKPVSHVRSCLPSTEKPPYPAQTRFGELAVYQDRCENGLLIARAVLPDPAASEARQSIETTIPSTLGEHDLCLIFTAPTNGPLYASGEMKLVQPLQSVR
jgi:hexosaminidase